ncbi:MAG: RidA family protein [Proteobacteria bacterium]|nr:RidA family protein [Pseudomonadota bacterium]
MRISAIVTLLAVAATGPWAQADSSRPAIERLPTVTVNGKALPFSAGVRVGDMLYLSGQIGLGADDKLPPGIEAQARNTLDRIGATLKSAGLGWKDVVRCAVFLNDMGNWPAFNAIYASYVDPAHLPARSALGSTGLALGALVEVQCEAYDPPH